MNFISKGRGVRDDYGQMAVYGGVDIDIKALSEAEWFWTKLGAIFLMFIEIPLSAAMDTVTLPITIPVTLSR